MRRKAKFQKVFVHHTALVNSKDILWLKLVKLHKFQVADSEKNDPFFSINSKFAIYQIFFFGGNSRFRIFFEFFSWPRCLQSKYITLNPLESNVAIFGTYFVQKGKRYWNYASNLSIYVIRVTIFHMNFLTNEFINDLSVSISMLGKTVFY